MRVCEAIMIICGVILFCCLFVIFMPQIDNTIPEPEPKEIIVCTWKNPDNDKCEIYRPMDYQEFKKINKDI